ncbi:hypothetical protein LCGC14_0707820 [marine sediment metagenome]|uniref:ABC3 transporter permease C-terminal domain-containing protein n=1 Tax=marine sediment metagenome TaxID=412755 RepID=A0A0F9T1W6_9ZZZZ
MSSFDFALKDFYRKKHQTYPYLLVIILVVAITEFLIYFTSSLGLNLFIKPKFSNSLYFTGSINAVYTQFNTLIQVLFMILAVFIVVAISTTLVISKKKDIAIMRAIGTIPRKLYSFYLLEVFIIFFIGFGLGLICGLISFGIFSLIMNSFFFTLEFQIDLIFTPILFASCFFGIFFITGYSIRKLGKKNIIKSFSKDIPYEYNVKKLQFIPKWLSSLGFNIKIAITNTIRRKGEFRRYILVFSLISLIFFTLGLSTIVLRSSSRVWIQKSQGDDIVIFGHKNVIYNYSLMYKMFSDPEILIDNSMINFTDSNYLFNLTDVKSLKDTEGVIKFDERLVSFYEVQEISGFHFFKDFEGGGEYRVIGQNRKGNFPILGVNPDNIIQDFEIEGLFFTNQDSFDNMTIGDGLAYNFFDYALDQSLKLSSFGAKFHISGVIIDSFFSGYGGYIGLNESRIIWNLNNEEINLLALKIDPISFESIIDELNNISLKLGVKFTYLKLDSIFNENLHFISNLTIYPMFLIIVIAILAFLSLYNYQKGGVMEKARDFLIMRAIGSKNKALKRILFLESLFIIIPSLLVSLGIGMILNSSVLFARVSLPPVIIPITLFGILLAIFIFFNYLSILPIMKKINRFSIKDFEIY